MRRYLIIPVIAGLLVTLGACGAKDEPAPTASETPAQSSSGNSTTTTEAAGDDETDATDDVPTGGIGDVPLGVDKSCFQVSALMMQSLVLVSPTASANDYDELEADIEEARADMPDEIRDAFDTWSEAWVTFAGEMEAINANGGFANPENIEKMEEMSAPLDTPEVKAASEEIEAYIEEKCDTAG